MNLDFTEVSVDDYLRTTSPALDGSWRDPSRSLSPHQIQRHRICIIADFSNRHAMPP